jgi:hypothetical protein
MKNLTTQNPEINMIKKSVQDLKRHFSKEGIQMTHDKCPTSLIHIKTSMRDNFASSRMAILFLSIAKGVRLTCFPLLEQNT